MAKTNNELGQEIHELLIANGIENPIDFRAYDNSDTSDLEHSLKGFCLDLGLSPDDPSTEGTPHRLAKMYKHEICWGLDYSLFPDCMVTPNTSKNDEMIIVRNIEVKSLCEHHFMPVIGKAHVAYLSNEKLLGLSKFNRVVEFFSRRPQLQERLCEQIHAALSYILDADVAVIIEAEHLCVKFRGIEDYGSDTVTSKMSGRFMLTPVRAELMSRISKPAFNCR